MVNHQGFTLLEVLVAIAIIAIAMSAVTSVSNSSVFNQDQVEQRQFSIWLANDIATRFQIKDWNINEQELGGELDLATDVWRWRVERANTPNASISKVNIIVKPAKKSSVEVRLQTFMRQDS